MKLMVFRMPMNCIKIVNLFNLINCSWSPINSLWQFYNINWHCYLILLFFLYKKSLIVKPTKGIQKVLPRNMDANVHRNNLNVIDIWAQIILVISHFFFSFPMSQVKGFRLNICNFWTDYWHLIVPNATYHVINK